MKFSIFRISGTPLPTEFGLAVPTASFTPGSEDVWQIERDGGSIWIRRHTRPDIYLTAFGVGLVLGDDVPLPGGRKGGGGTPEPHGKRAGRGPNA